jgi:hypothetical protein
VESQQNALFGLHANPAHASLSSVFRNQQRMMRSSQTSNE